MAERYLNPCMSGHGDPPTSLRSGSGSQEEEKSFRDSEKPKL